MFLFFAQHVVSDWNVQDFIFGFIMLYVNEYCWKQQLLARGMSIHRVTSEKLSENMEGEFWTAAGDLPRCINHDPHQSKKLSVSHQQWWVHN
jgi:hypothetical protein